VTTQAERLRKAETELAEVTANLSVLAAAVLTVAERNGTTGWGTLTDVITTMRAKGSAMARGADIVTRRTPADSPAARRTAPRDRHLSVAR
jgi:hypothetical protein